MTYGPLMDSIVEELKKIYDPEIPVNIFDLGLIYGIDCGEGSEGTRCVVTMTLTSAACPMSESIVEQVRNIGYILDDYPHLSIEPNLVFDPPWSLEKMSIEAKLQLGML